MCKTHILLFLEVVFTFPHLSPHVQTGVLQEAISPSCPPPVGRHLCVEARPPRHLLARPSLSGRLSRRGHSATGLLHTDARLLTDRPPPDGSTPPDVYIITSYPTRSYEYKWSGKRVVLFISISKGGSREHSLARGR